MKSQNHRILVIDDNPAIHEDFDKILAPSNDRLKASLGETEALLFGSPASGAFPAPSDRKEVYEISHALHGEEGCALVREAVAEGRRFPVAFIDMRMPPGWDGLKTAEQILKADPDIQIVICTAYSDYSWDEIRERLGVPDGLLILKKPFDVVEVLQISYNLTQKWQMAREIEKTMAELDSRVDARTAELSASRERLSIMFQSAPLAQVIVDSRSVEGMQCNKSFCKLTGFNDEQWADRKIATEALSVTGLGKLLDLPQPLDSVEAVIHDFSGEEKQVIISSVELTFADTPALLLMIQDITERHQLESEIRQLQKMEAVGQLAAGVAHDFNNLLTVIGGNAELAEKARAKGDEMNSSLLEEIIESSARATELTRKLLAFTRRQVFQPRALDVNSIVENQLSLLNRLLGEHIEVTWDPGADIGLISGDFASIEQVILNLAVNSRDAMPEGGRLALKTTLIDIETDAEAGRREVSPGRYISLTCTDTGHGMPREVAERAFEPFFTTKDIGKGTGLGLASAYGIVKRHRGTIEIDSQIDKGTSIRVMLPVDATATEAENTGRETSKSSIQIAARTFSILLVEDEPAVRRVGVKLLESLGHEATEAIDGPNGLEKWREMRSEIDLVITDMVMPGGMSGLQLVDAIQSESEGLPVILASGYSNEMLRDDSFVPDPRRSFLPKPYDRASLNDAIEYFAETKAAALPS